MGHQLILANAAFLAPLILPLEREGVPVEWYLRRFGLRKEMLFRPNALISKDHQVWGLLECVASQEGCDDFGFRLSLQDMFACGGALSQAVDGCGTLYQAVHKVVSAMSAYIQDERVVFSSEGEWTNIDFVREHPGVCSIIEQIGVNYIYLLLNHLASNDAPEFLVEVRSGEPKDRAYKQVIPAHLISFGAANTRVSIPTRVLGDVVNLPKIKPQRSISPDSIPDTRCLSDSLRAIVTSCLENAEPVPSVFEASSFISADRKTLYRILAAEGTSYSKIVQDSKYSNAVTLLKDTNFSIKEIAYRLGFNSPNNFCRAFRTKSGLSPERYRKEHSPD